MSQKRIQCFLIEPTEQYVRSFRRFARESDDHLHDARVRLEGILPRPSWLKAASGYGDIPTEKTKEDPRWPTQCSCGYTFSPEDHWQDNIDGLWQRKDTGELALLDEFSAGAMYYADWYNSAGVGPDGRHLVVRTPAGDWLVDQDRIKWTREGVPPNVTARPSILFHGVHGYHGFLTNGVLEECS